MPPAQYYRLGFLASHGGSNMQAIIDACVSGELPMKSVVVISNNSDAYALERAKKANIPQVCINAQSHPDEVDRDTAIVKTFCDHQVDLVILAGYMKKIGPQILKEYEGRILNIHPALLPKFGGKGMYGMKVHEAVLEAGEKESGVTVHLVDPEYDHGRILKQVKVPVLPDDTPETLQKRVLEQEHKIYAETLKEIAGEVIDLG